MSTGNSAPFVLPILVPTNGNITGVVFSPVIPDTAMVLFDDAPPQLHDLRTAGVFQAFRDSNRGIAPNDPTMFVKETMMQVGFRTPAAYAAYRRGADDRTPSAELSVVFGDEDTFVHRFNPRTGKKISPIYFANGSCIAYGADDLLLAAGSTDGTVQVFDLESDEPKELLNEKVRGGIRALCFEPSNRRLRVATEFNSLSSIPLRSGEEGVVRHTFTPEDDSPVSNMKISAMARADFADFIAVAGVGNEVWTIRAEANYGEMFTIRGFTRITKLQFVESSSELLVFGDGGLVSVPYEVHEGLPRFAAKRGRYQHPSERVRLAGAHQYKNLLCLVLAVPAKSDQK